MVQMDRFARHGAVRCYWNMGIGIAVGFLFLSVVGVPKKMDHNVMNSQIFAA